MPDMRILSEMMKSTALVQLKDEHGKWLVELCEPQAPNSKITIRNLPPDARVIKADVFRAPKDIFNNSKNECKRADYVIISAEKKCIIYIEMKCTEYARAHVTKQLLGAQCFIKYCQEIGKGFWSERNFLDSYKERFICIWDSGSIPKRSSKDDISGTYDTPSTHGKLRKSHYLEFNKLAGLRGQKKK